MQLNNLWLMTMAFPWPYLSNIGQKAQAGWLIKKIEPLSVS